MCREKTFFTGWLAVLKVQKGHCDHKNTEKISDLNNLHLQQTKSHFSWWTVYLPLLLIMTAIQSSRAKADEYSVFFLKIIAVFLRKELAILMLKMGFYQKSSSHSRTPFSTLCSQATSHTWSPEPPPPCKRVKPQAEGQKQPIWWTQRGCY